jgi:colanic acid/amylovoran biosynthesis glycosyltransferase
LDAGVDVEWHFVGEGVDRQRFERIASRLKVSDRAIFHGATDHSQLLQFYHDSHVLVVPSLSPRTPLDWVETQGVVIQEAQASGCIPIATRVGGISECVTDGVDGALVPDRSHGAIANAIVDLLANRDQWGSFQHAGRHRVEREYNAEVVGKRMHLLLSECIAEHVAST